MACRLPELADVNVGPHAHRWRSPKIFVIPPETEVAFGSCPLTSITRALRSALTKTSRAAFTAGRALGCCCDNWRLPEISASARRVGRLHRRGRRLARPARRRPGLAGQRRQRPGRTPGSRPTATHIAWTSSRDGAPEVHIAAALDGGPGERLTYWGSARPRCAAGPPTGEVLAVSTHGQAVAAPHLGARRPARRRPRDRACRTGRSATSRHGDRGRRCVRHDGPRGRRLEALPGRHGGQAVDRRGRARASSSACRRRARRRTRVPDVGGRPDRLPLRPRRRRQPVLVACPTAPTCAGTPPHDGFYARHAATDGTRVVYSHAGELWLLDDLRRRAAPARHPARRPAHRPAPRARQPARVGSVSPDHTGRGSAVEMRGTVHWVTHRDGPAGALAVEPGVRARLPRTFRADGEARSWVTDAEGEDALEFGTAPAARPHRWPRGRARPGTRAWPPPPTAAAPPSPRTTGGCCSSTWSPGEVREVDRSEHGDVSGLAFSPDSAWLAWSHPHASRCASSSWPPSTDLPSPRRPRCASATTARLHPRRQAPGVPVGAGLRPGLRRARLRPGLPGGCRPYLMTLAATTPSPFGPSRRAAAFDGEDDKPPGGRRSRRRTTPAPRTSRPRGARRPDRAVARRGRQLLQPARRQGRAAVAAPPGAPGVLGDPARDDRRPETELERYDLKKRAKPSSAATRRLRGQRRRHQARTSTARTACRPAPSGDGDEDVTVDLDRVTVQIDPAAEWRQMYDEAGRLMRDNFWRADMGGVDWDGVLDRYRPLVERVATHDELHRPALGGAGRAGHLARLRHAARRAYDPRRRQGLLGADISRDRGRRLARRPDPARRDVRPDARSPLPRPASRCARATRSSRWTAGRSTPYRGPLAAAVGTAGKPVELTVRPAAGGDPRQVVVVPLADEEPLRYHAWVADRRAYVHEGSGGRLGYLHVPDMVASGWAQIHRDLRYEVAREGLVVDVRENRGGHTSQLVVEKLARRIVGWDLPRGLRARTATRRTRRAARSSPSPTSSPARTATSSTRRSRRSGSARWWAPAPGAA